MNSESVVSNLRRLFFKAGWAPISVVVFHAAVAGIFGHKASLDPVMHFLGGAAIAFFVYHSISVWHLWFGRPGTIAQSLIAFCMTVTVAVFWEFMEFLAGALIGVYSQLSLKETMGDLLFGCLGALLLLSINALINKTNNKVSS